MKRHHRQDEFIKVGEDEAAPERFPRRKIRRVASFGRENGTRVRTLEVERSKKSKENKWFQDYYC
jgi:hypothetical protein